MFIVEKNNNKPLSGEDYNESLYLLLSYCSSFPFCMCLALCIERERNQITFSNLSFS